MLTTLSILSLDQGKLRPRPTSEEEYFARFAPKPVPKRENWITLRFPRLLLRKPARQPEA